MLDMTIPRDRIHLDDIEIGRSVAFGEKRLSKAEIIAYARAYDPQPIHLDEEAARKSIVGGLCASGFHSCAIMMRMLADDVLNHATSLGSPGFEEVRWLKPVRPDEALTARFNCSEKRELQSRPGVGIARMQFELLGPKGETLMLWDANQLLRVRKSDVSPVATPDAEKQGAHRDARPKLQNLWEMPGPEPSPKATYFEDRHIGESYSLGSHTFGREEILDFARTFDPQPFHLDEAAAKASLFGALSASGWHTAAIWIRQFVAYRQRFEAQIREAGLTPPQYGPSPGFKALRWLKPVYPGDTIEFRGRVADKLDWKSRPDRGLLVTENQGRNQKGEIVFALRGQIFAERRKPL